MKNRQKFAILHGTRRVWAIASIHSDSERLRRLHRALLPSLDRGDRIVYLGNMVGHGARARETLDVLISFRRDLLSRPRAFVSDIAYLRGSQEEMWQKLLQLQFATDPQGVLAWMLDQGLANTLEAYGGNIRESFQAARGGPLAITRWTSHLRATIQAAPGHYEMLGALRRAAFTDDETLLFVNAGLDPTRPLEAQSDSFWWGSEAFSNISQPYGNFRYLVRGFDPSHPGIKTTDYTITVDGGCGFGGALISACIAPDGEITDIIEA